jgi:hypothetical protein
MRASLQTRMPSTEEGAEGQEGEEGEEGEEVRKATAARLETGATRKPAP